MRRIVGLVVGIVWVGFAWVAFRNSAAGWSEGHSDLGFWWGVIGTFLAIAALSAAVGSWITGGREGA